MTANVKIPVASAENVTAVPLAAVFTEKASEDGQMERFVYVQQGEAVEKRNVKVGVSDFFYAEIQEGLKEGEIVSLEMPKDEREKKAKQTTVQKKSGGESGAASAKPPPPASGTNRTSASAAGSPVSDATPKTSSAGIRVSSPAVSSTAR
jgi:hypothetical protein